MEVVFVRGLGEELVGVGRFESLLFFYLDFVLYYLGFFFVVDGDFIFDDFMNLYVNVVDVDYLVGINDMDGYMFVSFDMLVINKNK